MPFLVIFVVLPLLEVAAFAKIGAEVGVINTLLFCVLTAAVGGWIVRQQGLDTLLRAQSNLRGGRLPLNELFDGFCIVIAGALLLTPGFVTDFMGFSLLVPPFRGILKKVAQKYGHFSVSGTTSSSSTSQYDDIIEGEYESVQNNNPEIDQKKDN